MSSLSLIYIPIAFLLKWGLYLRVLPNLQASQKKWLFGVMLAPIITTVLILILQGYFTTNIWLSYGTLVAITFIFDFLALHKLTAQLLLPAQIFWAFVLAQVYPLADLANVLLLSYFYRMT